MQQLGGVAASLFLLASFKQLCSDGSMQGSLVPLLTLTQEQKPEEVDGKALMSSSRRSPGLQGSLPRAWI